MMVPVFNLNIKNITGKTGNDSTKNVELLVSLKCLGNFWRTLEMTLINCEINLILTCSEICILTSGSIDTQVPIFVITDKTFMFQL